MIDSLVDGFKVARLFGMVLAAIGFTASPAWSQSLRPSQSSSNSSTSASTSNSNTPQDRLGDLLKEAGQRLTTEGETKEGDETSFLLSGPERWTSPKGLSSSLQILLLLTVLSLAPAVLLMTTCYVRIIVVLGLLRTAIGTPQLPRAKS